MKIRSRRAARPRKTGAARRPRLEGLESRRLLTAGGGNDAFIAVLKPDVDPVEYVAEVQAAIPELEVSHVYQHALKGFAFHGSPDAIREDPRVDYVEADAQRFTAMQTVPTGVDRIEADLNAIANIDGADDRVDVDIAIIDTGIDPDHPDLNVAGGVNFTGGSVDDWADAETHGTHVAGSAAALDNDIGVTGVAPGARLWALRVFDASGTGSVADIIASLDWVTANADTIEVANMSLGGIGFIQAERTAIANAVDAGVVVVVAAGNDARDIYGPDGQLGTSDDTAPAAYPEAMTISALADSDGQPGGLGAPTSAGQDDSFAAFSNFANSVVSNNPVTSPGAAIDLMMPGVDILSTVNGGDYGLLSGTSMASPHAAGLVSLFIAANGRDFDNNGVLDADDVYGIRQALIDTAMPQDSANGMNTLNDPDPNPDPIGWAENFLEVVTASPDTVLENAPAEPLVLGQLIDRAGLSPLDTYEVTIDWGDGSPPEPAQLANPTVDTADIIGTHVYDEGGAYEVEITVVSGGGFSAITETLTIDVESRPLLARSGDPIFAEENTTVTDQLVATFVDFDPELNPTSHYTALIDWGDGTVQPGLIQVSDAGEGFEVLGTHTFNEGGNFEYSVTISERGGSEDVTSAVARIVSAPIEATGDFRFEVQEGATFSGEIARFVDLDPLPNSSSHYTAIVDWGDGTTSTIEGGPIQQTPDGAIVSDGEGGFIVSGNHTYTLGPEGQTDLTMSVTIVEAGGSEDTAENEVTVEDAPILAEGSQIQITEGLFGGLVASFRDTNPNGQAAEFDATIEWGDGLVTAGVIEPAPGGDGRFQVRTEPRNVPHGEMPLTVEIVSVGGSTDTVESTVVASDAPIAARALPIVRPEGPFEGPVATFTDENLEGQPEEFLAVIRWGDGTTSAGSITKNEDGTFVVNGEHAYRLGEFDLEVTILSEGGSRAVVSNKATISDAPLITREVPVETIEVANLTRIVGVAFDTNPFGTADELSVSIDWGDGTVESGEVIADPNGIGFFIQGTHAYDRSGVFDVEATLTGPDGSTTTIETVADVEVLTVPVIGRLSPGSDTGLSANDAMTNQTRPSFQGFAVPGSTVMLFGRRTNSQNIFLIGEVSTSPEDGGFVFSGPAMEDGSYEILAASKNRAGIQNSPLVTIAPNMMVDTTGPRVADVFLEPSRGRLVVTLQDSLSGMNAQSLLNPALYNMTNSQGRPLSVSGVSLGDTGPDGRRQVIVTLGGGRSLGQGTFTVSVNGLGITDNAGNLLTESFFVPFPQIGNRSVPTYIAEIGTDGQGSTPPLQVVPPDQIRGASAFRRFMRAGLRFRPNPLG